MGLNRVVGIPYQIEEVTESFTVSFAVDLYQVDAPSGSPVTVTLDPNAVRGDRVAIQDIGGNAGTQPITIVAANGQAIFGSSTSIIINENYGRIDFTFNGSAASWVPVLTQGADPASFVQGGNAFGVTGTLGTTDNNPLSIITDSDQRLVVAVGAAGTTFVDAPGSLTIGGMTGSSITIGRTGIPVSIPGGVEVPAGVDGIDTIAAGLLSLGSTTATSIAIGKSGVPVTAAGGVTTPTVDNSASLTIGGTNATSVTIGRAALAATIPGGVLVTQGLTSGLDTSSAGALNIGATSATAIGLGKAGVPTTVFGGILATSMDTVVPGTITIGGTEMSSLAVGNTTNTSLIQLIAGASRQLAVQTSGNYACEISNSANTSTAGGLLIEAGQTAGGTTANFIQFISPNTTVCGAVTQASASSVTYGTTSDARLKERVTPSKRGLDVLRRVRVHDYNFIGDPRRLQGFLAQELVEIYPDAVKVGGEDPQTNPFSVDYGKLTPLLTLAIQELDAKHDRGIRELREEIAALRTKIAA